MSDPTPTDAPQSAADPAAGGNPQSQPGTDWQAKFEAQQKVNRDLEAKFNGLRDSQQTQAQAIAQALGIKPEDTPDVSVLAATVATLQDQFTQTQLANTVLTVAAENGITAAADLELLRSVKDESTMRTIAARIAATNGTDTPPIAAPGPRPDLTQGAAGTPATGSPEQDFANFLGRQMAG